MIETPVPIRPSRPCKYHLTEADKEYLRSLAVDGVIPIDVYISAMFKILNAPGAKHIYPDNPLDAEQPTK